VRLVAEGRPDHASEWDAMRSVAHKPRHRDHGDGAQVGAPGRGEQRRRGAETARMVWPDQIDRQRLLESGAATVGLAGRLRDDVHRRDQPR
jgi:hypothetical protein